MAKESYTHLIFRKEAVMTYPGLLMWIVPGLVISAVYADDGECDAWADPARAGTIEDSDLDEVSGLVSHRSGLGLWAHNDSGAAKLYAIGLDGSKIADPLVLGAEHTDWEDIAAGPCDDDPCDRCLYIADIGNNSMDREGGTIYRLPEPGLSEDLEQTEAAEAITFTWPDGVYDAEAFVVHPLTGEALLITKADPARLYRLEGDATLTDVGTLDLEPLGVDNRNVTGADVSPSGRQLVLRTDSDIILFDAAGQTLAAALSGEGRVLPAPPEEKAEAIAFAATGQAIFTAAESESAPLWLIQCDDFSAQGDTGTPECDTAEPCGCSSEKALLLPLLFIFPLARRRRH